MADKNHSTSKVCTVPKCASKKTFAKGLCSRHYTQLRVHGRLTPELEVETGNVGCKVTGCLQKHSGRGFCKHHLYRFTKYGDPIYIPPRRTICKVVGCERPHSAKDFCTLHYGRYKKYSDPNGGVNAHAGAGLKFLKKIVADPPKKCVKWPYGHSSHGYAHIYFKGGTVNAHAVALTLYERPKPTKIHHAAHKCHNRWCINPLHIYWATPAENMQDKVADGTHARGAKNPRAKVTEEQVRAIRKDPRTGEELSAIYGICKSAIYYIKDGTSWKHLD